MGHPEVAPDVLVGVGALLLADDDDPPAVDAGEASDHRRVVAEQPVAVELDRLLGHAGQELEGPRPPQRARVLDARPDLVARGAAVSGSGGGRTVIVRGRPPSAGAAVPLPSPPFGRRAACRRRRRATSEAISPTRSARVDRNDSGRNAGHVRLGVDDGPVLRRGRAGAGAGRASSSRSSSRATTRSTNPWLDRNSARWKPGGSSAAIVPAVTRAPAKPMSASGSAMLTSPTAANEANTPPVVGSDRTDTNGTPAMPQALQRGHRLGQLHERQRALLHPGATRRADDDERDPRGQGVLGGAGDLLADDRAHRAAHEPEVHDAQGDGACRRWRRSPTRRRRACRSPAAPRRAGPGRSSGRRTRGRRRTGGPRRARARCRGRRAARGAPRPTGGSGGRRSCTPAGSCRAAC